MPAVITAVLYTVLRWAIIVALLVLCWTFHKELMEYGWNLFATYFASIGFPSYGLPDLQAWVGSNGLTNAVNAGNEWLPLSEFIAAASSYAIVLATVTPIKMVLRRIPGING